MNLLDEFSIAIIFAALGALLLMAEVFFPSGGLIGLLAGCSFISAIYFAYSYGGLAGGLGFAAAEVILAPIAIYAGLQILPHTPMGKVLVGQAPTEEEVAPNDPRQALVGRVGVARSKLLPSGAVEIDGQLIDCITQGQAIDPGEYVKVVEVSSNRVVVRRAGTEERPDPAATAEDRLTRPAKELGLDDFDFEAGEEA